MAEPSKIRFTTISSQRHRAPSSSSVGAEMEMGTFSGAVYQQLSILLVAVLIIVQNDPGPTGFSCPNPDRVSSGRIWADWRSQADSASPNHVSVSPHLELIQPSLLLLAMKKQIFRNPV